MMIVYRVERPVQQNDRSCNGQKWVGPYSTDETLQYTDILDSGDHTVHPTPKYENLEFEYGKHVSAFASLDQLFCWFGRAGKCLSDLKFTIGIYECSDVQTSEHQAVCLFASMHRTGSISINFLSEDLCH